MVLGGGIIRNVCLVAFLAAPVGAQTPKTEQEGGDFTFRRVAPPQNEGGKRINVQIDPAEDVYRITPGSEARRPGDPRPEAATQFPAGAVPGAPGAPSTPSAYDWYWDIVTPAIGADPSARFVVAVDAVRKNADKVRTPRLRTLQGIVEVHGIEILKSTIGTDVSPALALAVIAVESAGRVDAESHAGAQGLMQLIPATAARFGVADSLDPAQNVKGGVSYLNWLLNEFNGDPVLALAGYNAGEGAVTKHGGVPPFKETRAYVPKVLAAWSVARSMCLTPPVLVSDGCVFTTQNALSGG